MMIAKNKYINKILEDNSLVFIPSTKVGQTLGTTTKEITPVIVNKADKLNTNLGIYTKNIINQSTPKLENAYYQTKVFVYTPENIIKGMVGVDVLNGAISTEPPITVPQLIGNRIKAWGIDPVINKVYTSENNND